MPPNDTRLSPLEHAHETPASSDHTTLAPFFQILPPELRNRIYAQVLRAGHHAPARDDLRWCSTRHLPPPSLLRTCRQIRQEAAGLYWTSHTFVFAVGSNLRPRMRSVNESSSDPTLVDPSVFHNSEYLQSGTLGLSSHVLKMLRNPSLRANFTSFVLRMHRADMMRRVRRNERRTMHTRRVEEIFPWGWIAEYRLRLTGSGWHVHVVTRPEPGAVRYVEPVKDVEHRVRQELRSIETREDVRKGMGIDQIARIAKVMRFEVAGPPPPPAEQESSGPRTRAACAAAGIKQP